MQYFVNKNRKTNLNNRLQSIINGDENERNNLINEYTPFIIKVVSNTINKYVEEENSPEYLIGLEAFNEAIDKYRFDKGSFINFASVVIKSRVIDYLRKMKKHKNVLSLNQLENCEFHLENQIGYDFTEEIAMKNEIEEFINKLKEFDISIEDLVNDSPKHKETRKNALRIAQFAYHNETIKKEILKKKRLPSKSIIDGLGVTSRILNRSRKFIIATVLILDSDLDFLKRYILDIEGGATNDL